MRVGADEVSTQKLYWPGARVGVVGSEGFSFTSRVNGTVRSGFNEVAPSDSGERSAVDTLKSHLHNPTDCPCRRARFDERSYYFFSSRRRHTRSLRDWSSDVCSSDLMTSWSNGPRSFDSSRKESPASRCGNQNFEPNDVN